MCKDNTNKEIGWDYNTTELADIILEGKRPSVCGKGNLSIYKYLKEDHSLIQTILNDKLSFNDWTRKIDNLVMRQGKCVVDVLKLFNILSKELYIIQLKAVRDNYKHKDILSKIIRIENDKLHNLAHNTIVTFRRDALRLIFKQTLLMQGIVNIHYWPNLEAPLSEVIYYNKDTVEVMQDGQYGTKVEIELDKITSLEILGIGSIM